MPKIILSYFGSEVNGLVSSLNQFLAYITLVEGGITGVILANLYKPLVDKDEKKLYKKNFLGYLFLFFLLIPKKKFFKNFILDKEAFYGNFK